MTMDKQASTLSLDFKNSSLKSTYSWLRWCKLRRNWDDMFPCSVGKHPRDMNQRRLWLFQRLLPSASCSSMSSEMKSDVNLNSASNEVDYGVNEENELPGVRRKKRQDDNSETTIKSEHVNPWLINQWMDKETGWERLREAYTFGSDGKLVCEDTRNLTVMTYRAILLGFFTNVFLASQNKDLNTKPQKFMSRSEAAVKGPIAKRTASKAILKEALRVTLRMSASAVTIFHLPHIIANYRNETTIWDFTVSAALACGCMASGARHALSLMAGGAVLGTAGGYFITGFLLRRGLSQEQRHLERVRQKILAETQDSGL